MARHAHPGRLTRRRVIVAGTSIAITAGGLTLTACGDLTGVPAVPRLPLQPVPPEATQPPAEATPTPPLTLELPRAGSRQTLPVHLLGCVGTPDQPVVAALRWQDGTVLSNDFVLRRAPDGCGLLIESLDWLFPGQRPPEPPTQPATIQVRSAQGDLLAQQPVMMLAPGETQGVTLYWFKGETLQTEQRQLPPVAEGLPRVALEELLWGPPPGRLAGYGTALPAPNEVLAFPGRGPDWGPRVTVRGLEIRDGVAMADFSRELQAYGGGSARVLQIREQVTRTLLQFPEVREVRIAVEGETTGVLEP